MDELQPENQVARKKPIFKHDGVVFNKVKASYSVRGSQILSFASICISENIQPFRLSVKQKVPTVPSVVKWSKKVVVWTNRLAAKTILKY